MDSRIKRASGKRISTSFIRRENREGTKMNMETPQELMYEKN